jgi:hypothetical protein
MLKGFDYWKSPKIKSALKTFWVLYIPFCILLTWLTLQKQNVSIFIFGAILPYILLLMFRAIRKPFNGVRNKIEVIDPSFFQELINQSESFSTSENKIEEGKFRAAVFNWSKEIQNQEIKSYIDNTKFYMLSSMLTLSIWFLGLFLVIYLIYFIK